MKPHAKICKPCKISVDLTSVKELYKLPCQELVMFYTNRTLTLPESFTVDPDLYVSQRAATDHNVAEFLISFVQNAIPGNNLDLSSCAGVEIIIIAIRSS